MPQEPKHFMATFDLGRLPKGNPLRRFHGRFAFMVTGYDADERELYEIPEVRAFVQSFRQAWPYWFFACNLQFTDLHAFTLCCLASLQATRSDGDRVHRVQLNPREFGRFLSENFDAMNRLFERAGMTEAENRERTRQILEYYSRDWGDFARALAGGQ